MNFLLKKLNYFVIIFTFLFALNNSAYGQQSTTIELVSDTSGYLDFSQEEEGMDNGGPFGNVVPTIKGELNVTQQGTFSYSIPIEVFKGVNDFQPNLALIYNSQSGNGQAGIGWNIAGLSSITIGGKSNRIDGTNEGVQYNGGDPFYLDGQRLIQTGSSSYITEQYSQIKISKVDSNTFKVQYTDGKVAKYELNSPGQFLVTEIRDAYDNKIFYKYLNISNVSYIEVIKYGGSTQANSPFSIEFSYLDREVPLRINRNGQLHNNSKYLNQIQVSSTSLGLHRKYLLTHDITSTKAERLRKVEVENGAGEKLKPLSFNYNQEGGSIDVDTHHKTVPGFKQDSKFLGSVTYGNFDGNGDISAVYLLNSTRKYNTPDPGVYTLMSSKYGSFETGTDANFNSFKLFSGRIIGPDGKFSENDKLLQIRTAEKIGVVNVSGGYTTTRKYTVQAKDINQDISIPQGNSFYNLALGFDFDKIGANNRCVDAHYFELNADFNNDGLIDRIIFVPPSYIARGLGDPLNAVFSDGDIPYGFMEQKTLPKVYFFEIGKTINSGGEIPSVLTSSMLTGFDFDKDSEAHIIEFNGDAIPEILILNRTTKKFSIYKVAGGQLHTIVQNISLSDFEEKTPLIFGDFNGDGLTDFITPQKVYSLEDLSINEIVTKINTEDQRWWQYISSGSPTTNAFVKNLRNFSSQKLGYCAPYQKEIIVEDKSNFFRRIWSGKQYSYGGTEYASCGVIPIDYNNDGRTDLVSFTKFGEVTYAPNDKLADARVTKNTIPSPNPDFANKIRFIENTPNTVTNYFDLTVRPENKIDVHNFKISPLSLLINTSESRGVELARTSLKFIDPIERNEMRVEINSTEFLENHLKEINNGSGVKQTIEYTPASTIVKNGNDITWHLYYKFIPEEANLPYPYFVNKHQPNYLLVKRVNTIFDGTAISKEYRYQNAMQNFDGKGFMGFQKIKVSDPYESKLINGEYLPKNPLEGVMWTINTYDPELENALVKTTYGSLDGEDILTSTENEYERKEKPNKQYTYVSTLVTSKDLLKDLTITKTYSYRTSDWLLEQVVTNFNGEATSTSTFGYKPSFTSGDHFFYGKINLNQVSITKGGQSFTTKDEYDFFTTNGATRIHRKYGHNTTPLIREYTYFANGNLQTEKVSGTGITALTTTYDYETTKRYVNKVTAPDGLISQSVVNVLGQTLSETSPLGLTTTHQYDNWGNRVKITDFLGLETILVKQQLANGQYSLSTQKVGSPTSIVTFDRFDRPIKTRTQSINSKWLVSDIVYDIYGKKIKESEPYFQDNPNILWNEYEYDALDRVVEQKLHTDKIITTCYEGMTVTVEDGEQKTSKTLDAMGNVIRHKDMGGEILYSYYPNGTLEEAEYDGITIYVQQDGWGNKTRLEDPSAGTYSYSYDSLGRILTEVTPKGQTTYTYDSFGKLLTETSTGDETNITSTYEYDAVTKLPKKITGTSGTNSFTYETFYDTYYRIKGKKETLTGAFVYQTDSEFDTYGRLKNTTLTTTVTAINKTTTSKIENLYEIGSGILTEQRDDLADRRIWKINEVNQKGQTKEMLYGNGFLIENEYNEFFLPTKIKDKNNFTNQTALEIDYVFDPQKRRLDSRNILVFSKNEQFVYDQLDRLTQEKLNNVVVNEYTYDKRGRMTYNKEVGTYEYNSSDYHIEKFKFNTSGNNLLNNRGFHQLKFNAFKQVTEIYLPGHDRINYGFNLFKKRAVAYFGSEAVNPTSRPIRKYYTSDNAVEIVYNSTTNKTDITTYVDGDPYSSSYIKVDKFTGTTLNSSTNYYLHRDYQGTILAITNTAGRVVEQRYFDAWGNIKQVKHTTWDGTTSTVTTNTTLGIIDRGYTGHEHLQSVGLIHMNGRLYDPVIRRFLSPDNFVQDPYNTQNFDRYGYVYNNPLMYTDPSGEEGISMGVATLIAVGVAILSNAIVNMVNGDPFWYGMGKSATMGAISGAISFGIGSVVTNGFMATSSFIAQSAVQAGSHAVVGGMMSSAEGGNFLSGFASGAVSSIISSGIQGLGIKTGSGAGRYIQNGSHVKNSFGNGDLIKAVTIAAGGLSGGISSRIAGGNFWSGVRQGLITSGLNHVAHSTIQKALFVKSLKQEMIDADIDPNSIPEFSKTSIIELLMKVQTLRDLWEKSGYIGFSLEENGYEEINGKKYSLNGKVDSTLKQSAQTKEYTSHVANKVILYKSAFDSYLRLGFTIGHELVHVHHINTSFSLKIYNMKGLNEGSRYLERLAYGWNMNYGDPAAAAKYKFYQ